MNAIFFTGKIKAAALKKELINPQAIKTIIAEKKCQEEEYRKIFTWSKIYYRFDVATTKNSLPETALHESYERVLRQILSDSRTYYLCERSHSRYGLRSIFNNTVLIENTVWNAINIIHESGSSQVVFQATPHSLSSWLFGKTAEYLGLKVFFAARSAIPWRIEVLEGIDDQQPLYPFSKEIPDQVSGATLNWLEDKKRSYNVAIPINEKERQDAYKGKHWKTRIEIKNWFSLPLRHSPFRLVETLRKYKALKKYTELTSNYSKPKRYCVFFLHYQPERTTLPEGGWYSHQWLAIRSLSNALRSLDACLVVKEHPSMFYQPWNGAFRDSRFYEAISMLPNTILAPLSLSPFSLIDSATCTASINGTVIYESLIRKTPVIAFGLHVPDDISGLFKVHDAVQTRDAVEKIFSKNMRLKKDSVYDHFLDLEHRTFAKEEDINSSVKAIAYLVDSAKKDS